MPLNKAASQRRQAQLNFFQDFVFKGAQLLLHEFNLNGLDSAQTGQLNQWPLRQMFRLKNPPKKHTCTF